MAVGHHIGDRAHVIERQVNAKTGEKAQNQEFINLDESEADEFGVEWKGKTHTLNHSSSLLHPSLGHSHRNHLAESRGLPSTSRPRSPVEGEGEARGRRRSRPVSLSAEDEETGLCHSTTTSTKKSPKMSRTKSPPHGHKPKPAHQNPHSHSSQLQTDLPPFRSEAPPTSSTETSRGRKKKGGKRTTFAADV
ncbi:Myeloid leukemia factor 1 [Geodia barretti]|uniref:Myeloid leukemia factor 1 n=2 Tax=Geodia barretti TaxID=519541 RepID=A0AA35RC22_GEOBA|nr:Myeloid leukemia factor 1 [Geodia barretti]